MGANFSNQKNLLPRIKSNYYLVKCDNSKELENFKYQKQLNRDSVIYQKVQKVMILKILMKLVSIDVVKNYSKLEMNDFICVLWDNERTKH